jgi:hypothetical protein
MATCEVCGNEYERSFEDETYVFDNFNCTIQSLSPNCAHCGCQVIGHDTEAVGFLSAVLVAPLGMSSLTREAGPSQLQVERSIKWLRNSTRS